jgi:CRISPR-associated endonuclease/helicase Cas3
MLDHIIAKSHPRESLAQHTDLVLKGWLALRERYYDYIPDDAFWEESFIAALFHDLGKITSNFQDMINKRKGFSLDNHIRHEFISGMFLFANNIEFYKANPLSLFAVFSHHKMLTSDLFKRNPNARYRIDQHDLGKFIDYAFDQIKSMMPEVAFKASAEAKSYMNAPYRKLLEAYDGHFLKLRKNLTPADRKKYILHKAVLNISDWTASGHRGLEPGLVYDEEYLAQKIKHKLISEGKEDIAKKFKYRDFQAASNRDGDVLAVAPTGSGKTEAALIWASRKREFDNILYLLPTRVTSNAIYKRLCDYFGDECVAVVHSSAFFLRKEINDNYEEKEYAFIDKTFFKNITVCTVDQILTQGFNLGFWEVKTFHQLNARIIIDEIHLYQPYTLGLIVATIQYLQENFGAHFYIMTATMPEKLRALLEKNLKTASFIPDQELLDKARNQFLVRKGDLSEINNEVKAAIASGKKVLLVLNTVDSAIQAYEAFKPVFLGKEDRILCYHSRFIQKHRAKKEKRIFEIEGDDVGCLLIATQVVEVSLDIDFDILFTENAPIDAIIQRAGRVNRKRRKHNTQVIVFQHSEIAKEYIYTLPNVLENTFEQLSKYHGQNLTEQQLLVLVNEVYKDIEIESNQDYRNGLRRYQEIQSDQYQIFDMQANEKTLTRLNIDTENIIPDKFQEKLHGTSPMKKVKYEVAVRRQRLKQIKVIADKEHEWFKYADVDYDFETGLKFKPKQNGNNTMPNYHPPQHF